MPPEPNAALTEGDKPPLVRMLIGLAVVAGSIGFALWQFSLLRRYAAQNILPAPPLGMDQVVYLFETYQAVIAGQALGAWHGLVELVRGAPAAGFGLQATAYAVLLACGISRMGALAVNFAYFVAAPGLVSLIVGRRQPIGFHLFLWGYWLSVRSMYALVGGPFDFRLDFAGMALFAMVVALVWRSDVFSRQWPCIIAALLAVWLCLTRFVVAVHLVVSAAILLLLLLSFRSLWKGRASWRGLATLLAVTAAGMLPYLGVMWQQIWGYYVVGHVTGSEKEVREAVQGFAGWREGLSFYPRALVHDQLGATALRLVEAAVGLAIVVFLVESAMRWWRPKPSTQLKAGPCSGLWTLSVVVAAALGPFLTLNADSLKSPVTANVFIVAAGGVGLIAFAVIGRCLKSLVGPRIGSMATLAFGAVALATGLRHEFRAFEEPNIVTQHRADFAARDRMVELVAEDAQANGWSAPTLFVDHVGELDGLQVELSHFERWGSDLPMQRLLAQIEEVPPDRLWPALLNADFLILRDPLANHRNNYPIDLQMARLNPQLQAFCTVRCRKLGSFTYFGTALGLYGRVRGPIPANWTPDPGIAAAQAGLSRDPYEEVGGVSPDGWIGKKAAYRFDLGKRARNAVSISGELPGSPPHGAASEQVKITVNGMTVAEQRIEPGSFAIRVVLPPIEGLAQLTIEGSALFPLAPPDQRNVSLRLGRIEWEPVIGDQ